MIGAQTLEAGKYILGVSGGVDSIVLLELLGRQPELEIIVAHFDHGIRSNSKQDRIFVEGIANKKQLPFYFAEGKLGPKASEATARKARYQFLSAVSKQHGAKGIVTAHHLDDILETALINLFRGTNLRFLS